MSLLTDLLIFRLPTTFTEISTCSFANTFSKSLSCLSRLSRSSSHIPRTRFIRGSVGTSRILFWNVSVFPNLPVPL